MKQKVKQNTDMRIERWNTWNVTSRSSMHSNFRGVYAQGSQFFLNFIIWDGPGSSVDIATGYGLDGPGIESPRERDILHLSRPDLVLAQLPVLWVPGFSGG